MKKPVFIMSLLYVVGLSACGGDAGSASSGSSSASSSSASSSSSSSSTSSSASSSSSSGVSSSGNPATVVIDFPDAPTGYGRNTTGGAGGQMVTVSTGTEIYEALCNRSALDEPIEIYIAGTITSSNTSDPSNNALDCKTEGDTIALVGEDPSAAMANISLIGVGDKAVFDGVGIALYKKVRNVIIRNVTVKDVSGDAVLLDGWKEGYGVENVWIDHNEIANGSDSLIDMKKGVKNVTVSYNYLRDSGRCGLIGYTDGDDQNTDITFDHNWYHNIDSRMPLLRSGFVHSYNNYFNGINKSGMNPRYGGRIKAERNYFDNARNPIGTFYTDDVGSWEVTDNYFTDTVLWIDKNSPEYDSSDSVDGSGPFYPAGPNPTSTATLSVPYGYSADPAAQVPAIVKANAGVNKLDKKGQSVSVGW